MILGWGGKKEKKTEVSGNKSLWEPEVKLPSVPSQRTGQSGSVYGLLVCLLLQ